MGIEPTSEAWEALNKTLKAIDLAALSFPSDGLNWNQMETEMGIAHKFNRFPFAVNLPRMQECSP
jgi:hypothetical protein